MAVDGLVCSGAMQHVHPERLVGLARGLHSAGASGVLALRGASRALDRLSIARRNDHGGPRSSCRLLLALVPTTILNWRSIDEFNRTRASSYAWAAARFAPITSYGAFNFANANHERADGGFNWDLPFAPRSDASGGSSRRDSSISVDRRLPRVCRRLPDGRGMARLEPRRPVTLFGKKLPSRCRSSTSAICWITFRWIAAFADLWIRSICADFLADLRARGTVCRRCWIAASHPLQRVLLAPCRLPCRLVAPVLRLRAARRRLPAGPVDPAGARDSAIASRDARRSKVAASSRSNCHVSVLRGAAATDRLLGSNPTARAHDRWSGRRGWPARRGSEVGNRSGSDEQAGESVSARLACPRA